MQTSQKSLKNVTLLHFQITVKSILIMIKIREWYHFVKFLITLKMICNTMKLTKTWNGKFKFKF